MALTGSAGPVMSREEVDRELARLSAEREAVEAALLALQDHPGRRLLEGAVLSGRTEERWSVAEPGLTLLWALFDRYVEALASARAVRSRRVRPTSPELAELSELLRGRAVTVPGGQLPDVARQLGGPARLVEQISLAQLLDRMNAWYATVLEVVNAADAVWSALPARIDLLLAELRRVRTLAGSVGVQAGAHPLGDDLGLLEVELTALRAEVLTDPLALWRPARVPAQRGTDPGGGAANTQGAVDTERFDRAGRALDGVRVELEQLLRLRDEADERLQQVADLLQRADATLVEARQARGEVLAKIAATEVPAVPGPLSALRERIHQAAELQQNGHWHRLAPLLDTLEEQAAKELTRARQSLGEVTAPLAVRAELRGRLDAYKAMAARLGVAEDPEVIERYEKARWLLWSAPCDLRAAAAAVARFQQALRPASGAHAAAPRDAQPGGSQSGGGQQYYGQQNGQGV
ncbi:hypothetical protein [Kitasatospora mediocidica]|uniref:hypothetical protein n=1 Tax=Kitasatospora mediocidica TaxID=58352 RepID=UPI001E3698CD|nr:hypothetical protein [Kitasatospora mediocidica]